MAFNRIPPPADIKDAIEYNPETGALLWQKPPNTRLRIGSLVGNVNSNGYLHFKYRGKTYTAHRAAWFIMTGTWPKKLIDHRNGNPLDNRWSNLRLATHTQNCVNRCGKKNRSLPKGVEQLPNGRFRASIGFNGKRKRLGCFDTPKRAAAAYNRAAPAIHGDFARPA